VAVFQAKSDLRRALVPAPRPAGDPALRRASSTLKQSFGMGPLYYKERSALTFTPRPHVFWPPNLVASSIPNAKLSKSCRRRMKHPLKISKRASNCCGNRTTGTRRALRDYFRTFRTCGTAGCRFSQGSQARSPSLRQYQGPGGKTTVYYVPKKSSKPRWRAHQCLGPNSQDVSTPARYRSASSQRPLAKNGLFRTGL